MAVLMMIALCFACPAAAAPAEAVPRSVAFRLEEKDLVPEGIAYDARTRQFFLSSINKGKVVAVSATGEATDFAGPRRDGLMETLGMKVDEKARRLWVLSKTSTAIQPSWGVSTRTRSRNLTVPPSAPSMARSGRRSPLTISRTSETSSQARRSP